MRARGITCILCLLLILCCRKENEEGWHTIALEVTMAQDDSWAQDDAITLITSDGEAYSPVRNITPTSFEGVHGSFKADIPEGHSAAYAVFPDKIKPKWKSGGIHVVMEEVLPPAADDCSSRANISIGKVRQDGKATLENVLALIKVTIQTDDIFSISYSGNNGELVAGSPVFDPETLWLIQIEKGAEAMTIQSAEVLPKGSYYLPVIPQEFKKGITITLTDVDGKTTKKKTSTSFIPERNAIYDFEREDFESSLENLQDDSDHVEEVPEKTIPDFSRVGYGYSDKDIPDYPVGAILYPSDEGEDRSDEINTALKALPSGTALLLKEGVYHVGSGIQICSDGIALRGEGPDKTIIHSTMKAADATSIISICSPVKTERQLDYNCHTTISDDHTPVGRLYVNVEDATGFNVSDHVVIVRKATKKWIHDIKMDQIPAVDNYTIRADWTCEEMETCWERVITQIDGNRIWLDNPVVMALDKEYGGGELIRCFWTRVKESGVEDLGIEADHDKLLYPVSTDEDYAYYTNSSYGMAYSTDEDHPSNCIKLTRAEHCWVRNIIGRHYVFNMVGLGAGARQITVRDCVAKDPVSHIQGSRRYAFHAGQGETGLFINCTADRDRHNFVTAGNTPGPHVFLRCTATNSYSVTGPHNKWATGVLYDNVTCTSAYNGDYVNSRGMNICSMLCVQDSDNTGKESHGWEGANFVFWNCDAGHLVCESPWVTGINWCIGCTGKKHWNTNRDIGYEPTEENLSGGRNSDPSLPCARPDGEWASHGIKVTSGTWYGWEIDSESLYESQLKARHNSGIYLNR